MKNDQPKNNKDYGTMLMSGMVALLAVASALVREATAKGDTEDMHHIIYHRLCEEFSLYDTHGTGPLWLSRVLSGIISDISGVDA